MNISSDVHNYMETLVGQILGQPEYSERYTDEQLADLACLALCQLRPVYIRYDVDFLSALPENRLVQLKIYADDAVLAAETMIKFERRKHQHNEENIPVVVNSSRYSDELELEWYEKPIIPSHKHP